MLYFFKRKINPPATKDTLVCKVIIQNWKRKSFPDEQKLNEFIRTKVLSCSVMSDSLWRHGLQHAGLLCPWDSPAKNTGVGSQFLLQGIFPTQWLNPGLLHCRQVLHYLSHQGSFIITLRNVKRSSLSEKERVITRNKKINEGKN